MSRKIQQKIITSFFLFLMLVPFISMPFVHAAGETVPQFTPQEDEFTRGFFNIQRNTIKFNDIPINTSTQLITTGSLPYLPLSIIVGDPYNVTTIITGAFSQQINGKLYTFHQWELWYYYDIELWTLADDRIIGGPNGLVNAYYSGKHDYLYHAGWGVNPWKWEADSPYVTQLGYDQAAVSGVVDHLELYFENYYVDPNWKSLLSGWFWQGALSYELKLDPRYVFPTIVNVTDGYYEFSDFAAGLIGTYLILARSGIADQFGIFVDQKRIAPLDETALSPTGYDSETGGAPAVGLVGGENEPKYYLDHPDAYYIDFFPVENPEPYQGHADMPPNGTPAVMTLALQPNVNVVVPDNFAPSAIDILNQQRQVKITLGPMRINPELLMIEGTHKYRQIDYYGGTLNWKLFDETKSHLGTTEVKLDWVVRNVYARLNMQTGVRVITLYEWNDLERNVNTTATGFPLSLPNSWATDRYIHAGIDGGLEAEIPPGFFDQFWWILLVIGVIVAVWLVGKVRSSRGGGQPYLEEHTGTAALLKSTLRGVIFAIIAAVIIFAVGLFIPIPVWLTIAIFAGIGAYIFLYAYSWWRSNRPKET